MTTLAQYEKARAALAEASRVDQVMHIRDEMEHVRLYARQIKDRALMAEAAEFQMRVERRLGSLLIAAKAAGQIAEGRNWKKEAAPEPDNSNCAQEEQLPRVTLEEVGVSRKLSAKAQKAASITEQAFEAMVQDMRLRMAAGKAVIVDPVTEDEQRQNRRNLAQELSDTSALMPTGRKYPCIYADPAWRRKAGEGNRSYENHYRTMTWDQILALPVKDMLLPDAWLFLWLPRAHLLALHPVMTDVQVEGGELVRGKVELPLAWAIAQAWGFDSYSTCFVWTKTDEDHPNDVGTGLVVRDQDEILCLFKRGKGLPKPRSKEKFGSNHRERSKPLGHSRKPDFYRGMIATMTGGVPVLEMFARVDEAHPLPKGWDAWGNQSSPSISIAASDVTTEAAALNGSQRNSVVTENPEAKADDEAMPTDDATTSPGIEPSASRLADGRTSVVPALPLAGTPSHVQVPTVAGTEHGEDGGAAELPAASPPIAGDAHGCTAQPSPAGDAAPTAAASPTFLTKWTRVIEATRNMPEFEDTGRDIPQFVPPRASEPHPLDIPPFLRRSADNALPGGKGPTSC